MNWVLANSIPYSSSVQGRVVMFLKMWLASSLLDIRCHSIVLIKDIHVHHMISTVLNTDIP